MKKNLTFLFVLNAYTAFCQLKPLQSITWVSDNFGTLHFTNANNRFFWALDQSFKLYPVFMDRESEYYQTKDTLVLVDPYREASLTGQTKQHVLYKFIMTRNENESISLSPVNDFAKEVIHNPFTS